MFLKRLEICGFKTFADKTEIDFVPGMMAVVGPNGSGKSNLTDALRYVLGEQSAKSLRASKLEELIFIGVPERRAAQTCEVTAVFDNSDGTLPIDFAEVALTRSTSRDGESRYAINGVSCRLKDIQELLMGSGIGPGSFFILGNREIDMVLSSDPKERRMMLEETAGTNRYKHRRREAVRKLEQAEQNLVRLRDVCSEVEISTEESRKALERYEQYKKAQDELKDLEVKLSWFEVKKSREALYAAQDKLRENEEASLAADKRLEELSRKTEALQSCVHEGLDRRERLQQQTADLKESLSFARASKDGLEKRSLQLEASSSSAEQRCLNLQARLSERRSEIEALNRNIRENIRVCNEFEAQRADLEAKLAALPRGASGTDVQIKQELEKNQQEQGRLRAECQVAKNTAEQLKQRLLSAAERIAEFSQDDSEDNALIEKLNAEKNRCREAEELERKASELLAGRRSEYKKVIAERNDMERRRRPLSIRVMEMEAALEDRIGMPMPVRSVMKKKHPGVLGVIGELIHVKEGMETAAEVAFGGRLNDIAVADRGTASELIECLKREHAGRATFWPLDLERREAERIPLPSKQGVVGYVLDLIDFDPKLRNILSQMAGQTVVMRSLPDALALYDKCRGRRPHLVTLQGEYLSASGAVTGGAVKAERSGMLARSRNFEEAKAELREAESQLRKLSLSEERLLKEITAAEQYCIECRDNTRAMRASADDLEAENRRALRDRAERESIIKRLQAEEDSVKRNIEDIEYKLTADEDALEKLAEQWIELNLSLSMSAEEESSLAAERDGLKARLRETEVSLDAALSRKNSLERELEGLNRNKEELESDLDDAQSEKHRADLGRHRAESEGEELDVSISLKSSQLEECTAALKELSDKLEKESSELRKTRREYGETSASARELGESLSSCRAALENFRSKCIQCEHAWQETPHDGFDENSVSEEFNPRHAVLESNKLKYFLTNFGSVNLGAREEYSRLSCRLSDLQNQIADINEASVSFKKIISEMDNALISRFRQVFSSVNDTFSAVFKDIFGGGWAKLELCDPDNLLESGIEISACPPGKKLQNLTLFSSGERALSAIAFLFSLLTHKPSPIVMLDELDAPLDDANVEKIAGKLLDFASSSQFLVITHNRKTMEFAQRLYGVTSETPGISTVLSVKLSDAQLKD